MFAPSPKSELRPLAGRAPPGVATETFRSRLRGALDHAATVPDSQFVRSYLARGYDPRTDPGILDMMALDLARCVRRLSNFHATPWSPRAAVEGLIARHWWLNHSLPFRDLIYVSEIAFAWEKEGSTVAARAEADAVRAGVTPAPMGWPPNVSLAELVAIYERTGKARGRTIAARIRTDPLLVEQAAAAEITAPARPGVVSGREDPILRLRSAALVVWAEKETRTNPCESEP